MSEYWVARQGEKHGPYPEEQVRKNYASGRVLPTDLVWTDGMPDWKAASQAFGAPAPRPAPPRDPAAATPYRPPGAKVRDEGDANLGGEVTYAGFWVRFGAVILDTIILYIVAIVVGGIIGFAFALMGGIRWVGAGASIVGILGAFLYFTLMESSERGATLGKRAFKLRVVTVEGHERIGFGRAVGRYFARFVSILVLYIGYLMQPFTRRKQALHDMICGTAVVALAPASRVLLGVAIFFGLLLPTLGIVAAVSIPAYQNYTVRAKVAEAILAASPARDAVQTYYAERNAFPKSLAEAGVNIQPTPRVQSVTINSRNAAITVTLAFSPLTGKTIVFVPERGAGGALDWKCRPGTVARKYLPSACRNS
jgi:uncharacterized RDD family membrane protein YckC/Tfp pilus assembly major pilin PilA